MPDDYTSHTNVSPYMGGEVFGTTLSMANDVFRNRHSYVHTVMSPENVSSVPNHISLQYLPHVYCNATCRCIQLECYTQALGYIGILTALSEFVLTGCYHAGIV